MQHRRHVLGLGCLAALSALSKSLALAAEPIPVDLELILAVDTSGSVSSDRFDLQKEGYSEAFANPNVLDAIRSGMHRAIAVTMLQWTGPALQTQVVDWMRIDDAASAARFSAAVAAAPRALFSGGTSISGAIDRAAGLFAQSGYRGERRVIDVSGDGSNNRGRPAEEARDDALRVGVGINGLPILTLEPSLDEYYRANVIGGPGAFVIAIDRYEDFAAAILRKLIQEIAGEGREPPYRIAR
ncbi:MAG TPA: DUF1194 domain-containing protein, partial [Stellaceae bacterium]|nr:DUF1194 domain-containing protein [Stellaceae bacterium]